MQMLLNNLQKHAIIFCSAGLKTAVPVKFKLFFTHLCVWCWDENEITLLLIASYLPLSCQFIHSCGHGKSANPYSQLYLYIYLYLYCFCIFPILHFVFVDLLKSSADDEEPSEVDPGQTTGLKHPTGLGSSFLHTTSRSPFILWPFDQINIINIISSVRSSYSHPDLLLIHHPCPPPTFSDHTGPQHWTFPFWATTAI